MNRAPALLAWAWLVACSGAAPEQLATPSPAPPPAAEPQRPELELPDGSLSRPIREGHTHHPSAVTADVERARAILGDVVTRYGVVEDQPWALGHALLALGPDVQMASGSSAVDHLFEAWAEQVEVGGESLVRFPSKRGSTRVEPHPGLMIKVLAEVGVTPDRQVSVQGRPHVVADAWRYAMATTWTDGGNSSYASYNESPWVLQALATWAPAGSAWRSEGHDMTVDRLTSDVVGQMYKDTAFMREAVAAGRSFEKKGQGIFTYTCGGAHLLQGASYAVARGFGTEDDRLRIAEEIEVLFHRLPFEVGLVDKLMQQQPDYAVILVEQRLKFLGHWLETIHKADAMGLFTPTEDQRRQMDAATGELVRTVLLIEQLGVYGKLEQIRAAREQSWFDYVGDSAHALRGLDLATGQASVLY